MKKAKEIGYQLCNVTWHNISLFKDLWNKTDIPTKDKIVNETGELAVKLVSNELIDYIENDAEIAIPIDEFFNEDGTHITKNEYGKVLIKYLVKELRNRTIKTINKNSYEKGK